MTGMEWQNHYGAKSAVQWKNLVTHILLLWRKLRKGKTDKIKDELITITKLLLKQGVPVNDL